MSIPVSPPLDNSDSALSSSFISPHPSFHHVFAFCSIVFVSINKTLQSISLPKALYNNNIYRRSNKICIERLIVTEQQTFWTPNMLDLWGIFFLKMEPPSAPVL